MSALLPEAIGTGLLVGLFFGQLFGITPGGMVVPGYIALQLAHPIRVVGTLGFALAVLLLVRCADRFTLLYGRRRFALIVILGFFLGLALEKFLRTDITGAHAEFRTIGFIVPGLIAQWMDQQGVIVTLAGLLIVSVITRLVLIAIFGSEVPF